jgi:hypothetical protein
MVNREPAAVCAALRKRVDDVTAVIAFYAGKRGRGSRKP